jgi:hypothetical protein
MNVEIGAEAAQFPEKEYINGIAFAVCPQGTFRPALHTGTATGTASLWSATRGFCTPINAPMDTFSSSSLPRICPTCSLTCE